MTICAHCGGDIAIRNPTGICDHLYYPDNCPICANAERKPAVDWTDVRTVKRAFDALKSENAELKMNQSSQAMLWRARAEGAEQENAALRSENDTLRNANLYNHGTHCVHCQSGAMRCCPVHGQGMFKDPTAP